MRVKRVHLGCSKETMAAKGAAPTRNKEQHHLNRDEKENKNRGPHSERRRFRSAYTNREGVSNMRGTRAKSATPERVSSRRMRLVNDNPCTTATLRTFLPNTMAPRSRVRLAVGLRPPVNKPESNGREEDGVNEWGEDIIERANINLEIGDSMPGSTATKKEPSPNHPPSSKARYPARARLSRWLP